MNRDLLSKIDDICEELYISRSSFIMLCCSEYINVRKYVFDNDLSKRLVVVEK
ncbi:MAG: hypothetical protein J1E81_05125 [Eubacterium sp.]|nr:hypothetical protein [Eubacterium sp.]